MVLPDGAAKDIDPAWLVDGDNIRVADAFLVDVMVNANGQSYESLLPYVQTIQIDGVSIQTVSLEGLLLTKQTMRHKDQMDKIILERAISHLQREPIQEETTPDRNLMYFIINDKIYTTKYNL